MKKRCLFSMVVMAITLMVVFPSAVAAQTITGTDAGVSLASELHTFSGSDLHPLVPGSSDNGTMTRAELLRQRGVPGKGIDDAPGLQKFFNSLSQTMERIRNMFRERERTTEGISDNFTVSDNTTRTKAEILKERGVPGKGLDTAPGLQKPFNPNSNAARHGGNSVSTDNITVSDNTTRSKAEILKERGVPGKGLDTAPGLQKPFNPESSAANKAGKNK